MSDIDTCPHCSGMLVTVRGYDQVNCLSCNFVYGWYDWLELFANKEKFVQTGNGTVAKRLRELGEEE